MSNRLLSPRKLLEVFLNHGSVSNREDRGSHSSVHYIAYWLVSGENGANRKSMIVISEGDRCASIFRLIHAMNRKLTLQIYVIFVCNG